MLRRFILLSVFISCLPPCLGQWTSTAWYRNTQGDSITGGFNLSETWDGQMAVFGIASGPLVNQQGGFIGLLDSDNGNTLTYRYLPKDSAMVHGRIGAVVPELRAFVFYQELAHYPAPGWGIVKSDLISFDTGEIIGELYSYDPMGKAFTRGSDSLVWIELGDDQIYLQDLHGNTLGSLGENTLPGGRLEDHDLQWLEEGDSLYGIYRPHMDSIRQVKIYTYHRISGQWGPTKKVECRPDESISGLSPKFRSLPYKIRTRIKRDSVTAMAEHSIEVRSLSGKTLLSFEIRNPYILENGNGGLLGDGSFVFPIDIWKKGGFYLISTKYRPDPNWTKTYERIMLIDSTGSVRYDKLLDNGASVLSVNDIFFNDKGEVYFSYSDWDRRERGVFKVGIRGIHSFLQSIPLESENQPFAFTVCPNPVQDYLQVKARLDFPEGSDLRLVALDGTVVQESSILGSEPVLKLSSNLERGLYILQVYHPWLGTKAKRVLISP
jgi:hypothetical protein